MSTHAQITSNHANALLSTGPRTEAGKERSSRNATTLGLFTRRDFVRPAEQEDYTALCAGYRAELNPVGLLEETFTAEIVSAAWRLNRCSALEARMAESTDLDPMLDPMEDESAQRLQTSIDRSRAQAHNLLRRSLAELRHLQTQRNMRIEMFGDCSIVPEPDLTNYLEVSRALDNLARARVRGKKRASDDTMASIMAPLPDVPISDVPILAHNTPDRRAAQPSLASICKPPAPTPRNARCPCGSSEKYKRCCGKSAPPILHRAA